MGKATGILLKQAKIFSNSLQCPLPILQRDEQFTSVLCYHGFTYTIIKHTFTITGNRKVFAVTSTYFLGC